MALVKQLRTIATDNNWVFSYGRRDFANLVEGQENDADKVHLFLDPLNRGYSFNAVSGSRIPMTKYNGTFLLVSRSSLSDVYDTQTQVEVNSSSSTDPSLGRWQKYIKPKIDSSLVKIIDEIYCSNTFSMVSLDVTEIINVFDENFDGIVANFIIDATDE